MFCVDFRGVPASSQYQPRCTGDQYSSVVSVSSDPREDEGPTRRSGLELKVSESI